MYGKLEGTNRTSSSMSRSRALNFSSNWPLIPEPAIIAARSIDKTRFLWRDWAFVIIPDVRDFVVTK